MTADLLVRGGRGGSPDRASCKKLLAVALAVSALALVARAEAQQPVRVYRLGYLDSSFRDASAHLLEAFRQGLSDAGYVEGKNIVIEYRYAEGKNERLADLAGELARLNVDVLLARATVEALAAKAATATTPIVMLVVGNPVAAGLVASLARPGGNITGLAQMTPEIGAKRLEVLKEAVPRMSRLAVLRAAGARVGVDLQMREIEAAAQALRVQLQTLEVRGPADFDSAFQTATRARAGALIVVGTPSLFAERGRIAESAAKSRLPVMYPQREYVEAGGLMSYGVNLADLYRRAATHVDKILKGVKPGDLPVEQPTTFELVINLKAARQIGLTIPPSVLARADRVIR